MKTVLVTGFEPFGRESINPSELIARALHGKTIAGTQIVGAVLPCAFRRSRIELENLIRRHRPQRVICLGLAAGRTAITPERVAINVDDARIKDNEGARPTDVPVVRGGPVAYWSTLPIKAIVAALRKRAIPATVSQTAGTFVCNHVFYSLMRALRRRPSVRGGFIHVPSLRTSAGRGKKGLPLSVMIDAITLTIKVALRTSRDIHATGGTIH
jgi:pyroglutamyl-peptidase